MKAKIGKLPAKTKEISGKNKGNFGQKKEIAGNNFEFLRQALPLPATNFEFQSKRCLCRQQNSWSSRQQKAKAKMSKGKSKLRQHKKVFACPTLKSTIQTLQIAGKSE